MKKLLPIAIAAAAFSAPTMAANAYFGGGLQFGFYEEDFDGDNLDYSVMNFGLKAGSRINEYFSAEVAIALGATDDSQTVDFYGYPVNTEMKLDHSISLFLKPGIPVNDSARFYGIVGFTKAEMEVTVSFDGISDTVTADEDGMSYGIGFEVMGESQPVGVQIEYVKMLSDDDFDYDVLGITLTKMF